MTEFRQDQPAGTPETDFAPLLALLSELAGYINTVARLAGPLTPEQAQRLNAPVREVLTAAANLTDMARHHGAMVLLDPEACEVCGTVDQPEFRHLTAEHYGTDGRDPADRVADALRTLFEQVVAAVPVKSRKQAERLLLELMDLAQGNLDDAARAEVVGRVLGRAPYPECCAYHRSGGRNPAYAHHEQLYAATP